MCSQVSTSILRLNQINATHILTVVSLPSAVFESPVVLPVVAELNVEWPNVDCSYTSLQTTHRVTRTVVIPQGKVFLGRTT